VHWLTGQPGFLSAANEHIGNSVAYSLTHRQPLAAGQ
jgi:hypothetical protein